LSEKVFTLNFRIGVVSHFEFSHDFCSRGFLVCSAVLFNENNFYNTQLHLAQEKEGKGRKRKRKEKEGKGKESSWKSKE